MKLIPTQEAVGHVLCHDMTQIIPGKYKAVSYTHLTLPTTPYV